MIVNILQYSDYIMIYDMYITFTLNYDDNFIGEICEFIQMWWLLI